MESTSATPTPAKRNTFESIASSVTKATGSTLAFVSAFLVVIIWATTGPFFHYSETWQLVINTGTTIITFLMVFLIQKSQNKDSLAIQLKLNELVAAHEYASNRLIDVESLTEKELEMIQKFYKKLNEFAMKEGNLHVTHSIDEAEEQHAHKAQKLNTRRKGK
jgi:low affinity Fe/Cu permease